MRLTLLLCVVLVIATAIGCGCRGQEAMVTKEVRTYVEERSGQKVKDVFAVRDGTNKYRCKVDTQSGETVIVRVTIDGTKVLLEAE